MPHYILYSIGYILSATVIVKIAIAVGLDACRYLEQVHGMDQGCANNILT